MLSTLMKALPLLLVLTGSPSAYAYSEPVNNRFTEVDPHKSGLRACRNREGGSTANVDYYAFEQTYMNYDVCADACYSNSRCRGFEVTVPPSQWTNGKCELWVRTPVLTRGQRTNQIQWKKCYIKNDLPRRPRSPTPSPPTWNPNPPAPSPTWNPWNPNPPAPSPTWNPNPPTRDQQCHRPRWTPSNSCDAFGTFRGQDLAAQVCGMGGGSSRGGGGQSTCQAWLEYECEQTFDATIESCCPHMWGTLQATNVRGYCRF